MEYNTKKFDETNTGILFKNTDEWQITHQGKLNIDGEEHRIIGVLRKNKDKEWINEIYKAMGTLKVNKDKNTENHPDSKGVINKIKNDGAKIISGWKKTSGAGNKYTSLSLRDFDDVAKDDQSKTEQLTNEEVENIRNSF